MSRRATIFPSAATATETDSKAHAYRQRPAVAAAWVVAGLILGPLMLVALIGFHGFPVCVPCPACRRERRVERSRCRHCGSSFPLPRANGTEIFAGALPSAAPAALAAVRGGGAD